MLHLIRFDGLLRFTILATVFASLALFYVLQCFFPQLEVYRIFYFSSVITALVGYIALSPNCYRWCWRQAKALNKAIYPDLNGTWSGTIEIGPAHSLEVRAVIRQSLLVTEIDLHARTTKSITLAASAMVEGGQPMLYYIYRAEPKNPDWPSYSGTTRMTVRVDPDGAPGTLALSGQYYTSRKTTGTIQLRQTGTDPSVDVAFY